MTVATTFYTVFESARVCGANPNEYLRYAAEVLLDGGDALLPHEWLAHAHIGIGVKTDAARTYDGDAHALAEAERRPVERRGSVKIFDGEDGEDMSNTGHGRRSSYSGARRDVSRTSESAALATRTLTGERTTMPSATEPFFIRSTPRRWCEPQTTRSASRLPMGPSFSNTGRRRPTLQRRNAGDATATTEAKTGPISECGEARG